MAPLEILLKDSTMREGLDVPGVSLDAARKRLLLERLAEAGITEVEIVAPGRFDTDLRALREMAAADQPVTLSGLIYGYGLAWREQVNEARYLLDRVDILAPLADRRPPAGRREKLLQMREAVGAAAGTLGAVGVGFPHATQVEPRFVLHMSLEAVQAGARRITLYDTNGGADPWTVAELVTMVHRETEIEICFHAHNDLGMATANSLSAVRAGAGCLDVTVNGLGDRAGNASMEQVAVALHIQGIGHGIRLDLLRQLARTVADVTHIPVPELAPVAGDYVFQHKSPAHLEFPELFEAYDPALVGTARKLCKQ